MALGPLVVLVVALAAGTLSAEQESTTSNAPSTKHFTTSSHTNIGTLTSNPVPKTSTPTIHLSTTEPASLLSSKPPETTKKMSNETIGPVTATALSSSKEPLTSQKAESPSHSTATGEPTGDEDESHLTKKPGLVAVICIFLSILLIGAVVIVVKCCRSREPAFQKLDEVPMQGKAAEDSPFARYPPK